MSMEAAVVDEALHGFASAPSPQREPGRSAAVNSSNWAGGDAVAGNAVAPAPRKPAWNVPPQPPVPSGEVGPIMGASSWPALADAAARAATRSSSSSDSLKSLSESVPSPPEPVIPLQSPRNNLNSSSNNTMSNHNPNPTSSSYYAAGPRPNHNANNPNPRRDRPARAGNWNNGNRLGNAGHGGNNRNNRHDPENPPRNPGGREHQPNYYQQQHRGHPRQFHRPPTMPVSPPPPPPSFFTLPPPHLQFRGPVGYPEMPLPLYFTYQPPPPELFQHFPFAPQQMLPQHLWPPQTVPPHDAIRVQIEFYFSNSNLVKDTYLRSHMNDQGWVDLNLIANFNKVKSITTDLKMILDALQHSELVEVQGERIRRRNDWMNWLLPPLN